jgi:ParB family chromosome partitioning protein
MITRNQGIKANQGESAVKLLSAFVRKADEGTIGKLIVEAVILLSARTQREGGKTLRAAAQVYGVDTEAIALRVKREFAAKDKARNTSKPEPKPVAKTKQLA